MPRTMGGISVMKSGNTRPARMMKPSSFRQLAFTSLFLSWLCCFVAAFPIGDDPQNSDVVNVNISIGGRETKCDFFGTNYHIGQVWQTHSEFAAGCLTCQCREGGVMECKHTPYEQDATICRNRCASPISPSSSSRMTATSTRRREVDPDSSWDREDLVDAATRTADVSLTSTPQGSPFPSGHCCRPCPAQDLHNPTPLRDNVAGKRPESPGSEISAENGVEYDQRAQQSFEDESGSRGERSLQEIADDGQGTGGGLRRTRKSARAVADPLSMLSHEREQRKHPSSSMGNSSSGAASGNTGAFCTHDGKVYSPGESMVMANAGGAGGGSNAKGTQCFQCRCSHGRLWCHPETCVPLKCKNAIRIANGCCPICRDDAPAEDASSPSRQQQQHQTSSNASKSSSSSSSSGSVPAAASSGLNSQPSPQSFPSSGPLGRSPFLTPSSEISVAPTAPSPEGPGSRDCYSGGRRFVHGSEWHPVIGPFGEMECVVCGCDAGQISCHRLYCPSAEDLGCTTDDLVKIPGRCCPSCPDDTGGGMAFLGRPPPSYSPSNRSRGDRNHLLHRSSSNNNNNGNSHEHTSQTRNHQHQHHHHASSQRYSNSEGDDSASSGEGAVPGRGAAPFSVCSPPGTDVVAYMMTSVQPNGTKSITYIFHKKDTKPYSKPIEKHKWTWDASADSDESGEQHKFETFYEGTEHLDRLKRQLPLTILGSTSSKYLERFTKKEKKLDSRCVKRCQERVRKLETFLRLRPIHYRRQCRPNEIALS